MQCHQTRSREWNRSLARKILRERGEWVPRLVCLRFSIARLADASAHTTVVDLLTNPGASKLEAKWSKQAAKKAAQARKRKRKLAGKNASSTDPDVDGGEEQEQEGHDIGDPDPANVLPADGRKR